MSQATVLLPVRAYHASGVGHANCADIIRDYLKSNGIGNNDSTRVGLSHVIGFALEAALKAYLAKHGLTRVVLMKKPYGHDLSELLAKAKELGLESDGIHRQHPELLSALENYVDICGNDYKTYNYRYIEKPALQVLDTDAGISTAIAAIRLVLDIAIS